MNLLGKLLITGLVILCLGCAKPKTIIKTEYQEVKIPVRYKLKRPDRPVYLKSDSIPVYLLKLVEYTTTLEIIIDENNTKMEQ